MQQLRQHTFGCGHCALCVAAKSVFALFAGFLTLALTFASTLILSSVLFTSTAFAQVNAENSGRRHPLKQPQLLKMLQIKPQVKAIQLQRQMLEILPKRQMPRLLRILLLPRKMREARQLLAHRARRKMRQTMVRQTLARKRQITAIHKQIQRPFLLRI